ncbi:hypothetical protein F4804DRAFT_317885 [Jackrogersella minutella]|nr:hypothetical protein F4804DRAFT_317885 [Jackrogersella minutella]
MSFNHWYSLSVFLVPITASSDKHNSPYTSKLLVAPWPGAASCGLLLALILGSVVSVFHFNIEQANHPCSLPLCLSAPSRSTLVQYIHISLLKLLLRPLLPGRPSIVAE